MRNEKIKLQKKRNFQNPKKNVNKKVKNKLRRISAS
jgi:hypothetical protein